MTPEDLLTRTFAEVTETTDYPSTPMATVVARSRSRRRTRRRTTALVAAAAVALVGASATVWLGRSQDSRPSPVGPLASLRQGAAPRIGFLDGDTFVASSGARITAPVLGGAASAASYGDGVLASATSLPTHPLTTLSIVSPDSSVRRLGCGLPEFAARDGGKAPAYWLSDVCRRPHASSVPDGRPPRRGREEHGDAEGSRLPPDRRAPGRHRRLGHRSHPHPCRRREAGRVGASDPARPLPGGDERRRRPGRRSDRGLAGIRRGRRVDGTCPVASGGLGPVALLDLGPLRRGSPGCPRHGCRPCGRHDRDLGRRHGSTAWSQPPSRG